MSNILNEFIELVQIDSDSLNERNMADALTAKLKEIGCDVWEDKEMIEDIGGTAGNLYGVLEGTCPGSILFSAHMDRVANGHGIKPVVNDGIVTAQGTILAADDLSGVCAILDGIRRVKASGKPHPRVEVLFTVCEEKGVTGSRYIKYDRILSKEGYALDSPGRIGRVINAAPSAATITYEVEGKNAHAGNAPEQGINAVMAAAKVLSRIPDGRLDFESTANFSTFEAVGPTNVVNAKAVVKGESRSRSNEKLDNYLELVQKTCDEVAAETGAKITLDIFRKYYGFVVEPETSCIGRLKKVYDEMGIEMLVEKGGGGMDANRLNEHGIACVGVATGYFKNHSVNEHLYVEDLERSGEMVERIIYNAAE